MNAHQLDANGVILNTIVVDSLDVFPNLIDASVGGSAGDTWNGTAIVKKPLVLSTVLAAKKEQLAAKSLEVETQGITVGANDIGTDREAVARITSALSLMGRRPAESTPFKTKGGWATGTKGSLETIQSAVWEHLKATATNEKAHSDAIDLLTTASAVVAYDISTGW